MRTTIETKSEGTLSFWASESDSTHYVYLEGSGKGILGRLICQGGGFSGTTVTCDGTEDGLRRAARKWWRQHLTHQRKLRAGGWID